jgi:hypothetical protein
MVASELKAAIPQIVLSNFEMPYWGISHPSLSDEGSTRRLDLKAEQYVDFRRISRTVGCGMVDWIDWYGYGQRIEYFPPREDCQKVFSYGDSDHQGLRFGSGDLVCPIRGAEILDARHPGYVQIPARFYREMADRMQLRPVFIGQIEDNAYLETIQSLLPDAVYIRSQGPIWDFQTARKAKNIVVPVSTFGWLAAWLSNASKIILPVFGLFNPRQFPSIDLLPLSDERYEFYDFPLHDAVPVERIVQAHQLLSGKWTRLTPTHYRRL